MLNLWVSVGSRNKSTEKSFFQPTVIAFQSTSVHDHFPNVLLSLCYTKPRDWLMHFCLPTFDCFEVNNKTPVGNSLPEKDNGSGNLTQEWLTFADITCGNVATIRILLLCLCRWISSDAQRRRQIVLQFSNAGTPHVYVPSHTKFSLVPILGLISQRALFQRTVYVS